MEERRHKITQFIQNNDEDTLKEVYKNRENCLHFESGDQRRRFRHFLVRYTYIFQEQNGSLSTRFQSDPMKLQFCAFGVLINTLYRHLILKIWSHSMNLNARYKMPDALINASTFSITLIDLVLLVQIILNITLYVALRSSPSKFLSTEARHWNRMGKPFDH